MQIIYIFNLFMCKYTCPCNYCYEIRWVISQPLSVIPYVLIDRSCLLPQARLYSKDSLSTIKILTKEIELMID